MPEKPMTESQGQEIISLLEKIVWKLDSIDVYAEGIRDTSRYALDALREIASTASGIEMNTTT